MKTKKRPDGMFDVLDDEGRVAAFTTEEALKAAEQNPNDPTWKYCECHSCRSIRADRERGTAHADSESMTERQLWALLLEADLLSEMLANQNDGEKAVRASRVGAQCRVELRDRFHLNLDDLCDEARRELIQRMSK